MLGPITDFAKRIAAAAAGLPGRLLAAAKGVSFLVTKAWIPAGASRLRVVVMGGVGTVALVFALYALSFVWHASWIRGYDLSYPKAIVHAPEMKPADDTTVVELGRGNTRTCARSQMVDMQIKLIDFMVNENAWIPAMPQFKAGFLGLIKWDDTPFLDDKASFQHGLLYAVRRTSVELSDVIGRVRGTSQADSDLQNARGSLQYDSETWWINPFDKDRPFGPVQPAANVYRKSIELYERFNTRLGSCAAVIDARADNLRAFMDRVANDLGSIADGLNKRSMGTRYDPKTDEYVEGEGNDRGWFDMRADNLFREASGTMYAYHGILQAARKDFAEVVKTRQLEDVWDRLERNVAEAAALNPLIVANGKQDGFLIPDHLAIMAENVLRARANVTEVADILDR